MTDWTKLEGPIVKMTDAEVKAENDAILTKIIKQGEEKKQRVLRFLEANSGWKIQDIVKKFDLDHDVKKDLGNGLVKMSFFADESMRVECFELTMPYSEVLETLK